jgi:hypothetical protein
MNKTRKDGHDQFYITDSNEEISRTPLHQREYEMNS